MVRIHPRHPRTGYFGTILVLGSLSHIPANITVLARYWLYTGLYRLYRIQFNGIGPVPVLYRLVQSVLPIFAGTSRYKSSIGPVPVLYRLVQSVLLFANRWQGHLTVNPSIPWHFLPPFSFTMCFQQNADRSALYKIWTSLFQGKLKLIESCSYHQSLHSTNIHYVSEC